MLAGILALGTGGGLCVAAAITVAPRLATFPAMLAVDAVQSGVDVSLERLTLAKTRFDSAEAMGIGFAPDLRVGQALVDISLGAHPERDEAARRADLTRARDRLREVVGSAPLDGVSWMQLAYLEFVLNDNEPSPRVLDALRMSTRLMEYDPIVMIKRLHLWFAVESEVSGADLALFRRQLQLAFETQPGDVLRLARDHGRVFALRRHLEQTPIDPGDLDRYLPVPFAVEPNRAPRR